MNWKEFMEKYNARAAAAGAIDQCGLRGAVRKDGDAVLLSTAHHAVSVIFFEKDKAEGALVIGPMMRDAVTALEVYAFAIDTLMDVALKKRNEYLERLHLFDGKLLSKGSNLTVKGHLLEVRPRHPGAGLICFTVANTDKLPDIDAGALIHTGL